MFDLVTQTIGGATSPKRMKMIRALFVLGQKDLFLIGQKEEHDEDSHNLNERLACDHLLERKRHLFDAELDQLGIEGLNVLFHVREKFIELFEY